MTRKADAEVPSRETFLTRALDLGSLEALNRAFASWIEDEYRQREHARSA